MIEIGLALGAAKKAFDLIQSAIDTGQQASGLLDQLENFYNAKDKVQEAKEKHKRKPNGSYGEESVESYALKIIQAEIACDDYEAKIKKMFIESEENYRVFKENIILLIGKIEDGEYG